MENIFAKHLLKNGWEQPSAMTFKNIKNPKYEIFFDTSNQIELYFNNERKDEKYLIDLEELVLFLKQIDLTNQT
jgi:hypothetical protein